MPVLPERPHASQFGGGAALLPAVLRGRCPRCGQGALFDGVLELRPACAACGLDLRPHNAGDGPAVAAIFILGAAAMLGAFLVEFRLQPPLWVHAVLWPVLVIPAAVMTMRIAKALLVALHYRHRSA